MDAGVRNYLVNFVVNYVAAGCREHMRERVPVVGTSGAYYTHCIPSKSEQPS